MGFSCALTKGKLTKDSSLGWSWKNRTIGADDGPPQLSVVLWAAFGLAVVDPKSFLFFFLRKMKKEESNKNLNRL